VSVTASTLSWYKNAGANPVTAASQGRWKPPVPSSRPHLPDRFSII
jgi:hypothetical protein